MPHVASRPRVEERDRLAIDPHDVAGGAGDLAPDRVTQRSAAVVAEDGHVHPAPGRHLEQRGVDPLAGLRALDEVRDPVRLARHRVLRVLLHHHVDRRTGVRGHAGGEVLDRRAAEKVVHHDEGPARGDREERHDEGNDPGRHRHQPPPRFFTASNTGRPPAFAFGDRKPFMFPDLAFGAPGTARTNVLNDEIVIISGPQGDAAPGVSLESLNGCFPLLQSNHTNH